MKKFVSKRKLLPISIKRFSDVSAEPLFACKKRKFKIFSYFFEKDERVCRKWTRKNTIKCLLISLPLAIVFILTGGICASVSEKINLFTPKNKDIKSSFLQNESENDTNLLITVNANSPLPKDFKPDLTHYMQVELDKKLLKDLKEMLTAAQKCGYVFDIKNGFISEEIIKKNYDEKLNQLLNEGYTKVRAEASAEKLVSYPGKSEYQTGLLLDICSPNLCESEFFSSDAYKWLTDNCVNYGFVQRYPADKVDKTGKKFKPCAFRFVGKNNAQKMRSFSMCLEEFSRYVRAQK